MSEIKFSNRFKNLVKVIDHRISKIIIDLENKDFEFTQNYIDITDKKDTVSFTPERKVNEIKSKLPKTWVSTEETRNLTHGAANDSIYKRLNYIKPDGEPWRPEPFTSLVILAEAKSKTTDRVYVVVKEYDGDRQTVVNKDGLMPSDNYNKIWTSNRNTIRIGRLTRSLLTDAKVEFTTKEIEEFTNQFKAAFDFSMDATNKFDIVSGDDIVKWYHYEKYVQGGGTLNNSCMANVRKEYLDIYSKNPQVKLVILYDDEGKLEAGKYTSDKIKGRAILWCDTNLVNSEDKITFMDRIYTVQDSDTDLFKRFAESKGFWYKRLQNMEQECRIFNGVIEQHAQMCIKLDEANFSFYPYTDTMSYANLDNNTISNICNNYHRKLRSTTGGYEDENENYFDPQDYDSEDDEGF